MKTKIVPEKLAPVETTEVTMPPPPPPQLIQLQQAPPQPTSLYVLSILATIFCCLPCGVIGLVHTMVAGHEAEKGNLPGYRRRIKQGRCWTGWAIGLGLVCVLLIVVHFSLGCPYLSDWYGDYEYDEVFAATTPAMKPTMYDEMNSEELEEMDGVLSNLPMEMFDDNGRFKGGPHML